MTTRSGPVAPILLAVIIVVLTACAPTPPPVPSPSSPSPTSTASDEPTPSGQPSGARPPARLDITCDEVAGILSGLLRDPLPALVELPALAGQASWLPGPARYAVPQIGGLVCTFGDGITAPTARVVLVPDGAAAAAAQEATVGITTPSGNCSVYDFGAVCSGSALLGDTFLELAVQGAVGGDSAEANAAFARTRDALVAGAGQPVPASAADGIVATCAQLLPLADATAILGGASYTTSAPSGGWGVLAWTIDDRLGATPCYFSPDGEVGVVSAILTWLPGGAWAYDPGEPLQTVPVAGAEEAAVTCTAADDPIQGGGCSIDIRTTADWFRFTVPGAAFDDASVATLTEAAATIASNATAIAG